MSTMRLFSKSVFSDAVSGSHVTCSPTIDLVATASDGNNVFIWRANAELVVQSTERNAAVQTLTWKQDGQFLAVGWSDGVVRLMGLENNKAVHHIPVAEGGSRNITHIAWARNHTNTRRRKTSDGDNAASWDKILDRALDAGQSDEFLDLPHELTFLEVETSLPKLSPLPVTGGSGEDDFVFSTRTSLDFIFRPVRAEDTDSVDAMIVGTQDGGIHLSIYDSFVIGSFRNHPFTARGAAGLSHLCCHASHPDVSTHALLLRPDAAEAGFVNLVPLDLCFIQSSPVNLCLLASKTTALQNLLRYIKQTQLHMNSEWKSAREMPDRFLSSLSDDLQKMPSGPMTVVQALFHTVVTGHVFGPVKEWLTDSLAEWGHKRWAKAVSAGLENLRTLVHQNMLPALERSAVILSRLRGLTQFHDSQAGIGVHPAQIKRLMDIVSCLTVVSHRILLEVMEELDLFAAFSSWLRFEIDKLASPSATDELTEKEASMAHAKVLAYIQGYLANSPMSMYFDDVAKEDYDRDWEYLEQGAPLIEVLDKQFKRRESGQQHMKALPHVEFLVNYLVSRADVVFRDIAEAEKRSVRFGKPSRLDIGHRISKVGMQMRPVRKAGFMDGLTFTALTSDASSSQLYIFRTEIHIINGISSAVSTTACCLFLGGGRIVDFTFVDDKSLLVLWLADEQPLLLVKIPYQSKWMSYLPYKEGEPPKVRGLTSESVRTAFDSLELPADPTFTPVQMEVRGPTDARGEIPARLCLLGSDRVTYKVFALPGAAASHGGGNDLTGLNERRDSKSNC